MFSPRICTSVKLSNSKAKVTPSVHAIFKSGVGRLFKSIFACEFVRLKSICCLLLCNYFPSQYKYLQKPFVVGVGETKQIKRSLLKVLLQPIFVSAKHFMRRESRIFNFECTKFNFIHSNFSSFKRD